MILATSRTASRALVENVPGFAEIPAPIQSAGPDADAGLSRSRRFARNSPRCGSPEDVGGCSVTFGRDKRWKALYSRRR